MKVIAQCKALDPMIPTEVFQAHLQLAYGKSRALGKETGKPHIVSIERMAGSVCILTYRFDA